MFTLIRVLFVLMFLVTPALATDPPLQGYDEGVLEGTVFKINCVGSAITCTKSGNTLIIAVSGVSVSGVQDTSGNNVSDTNGSIVQDTN